MHLFSRAPRPRALSLGLTAVAVFTACADQLTGPVARPAAPLTPTAAVVSESWNGRIRIGVVPAATSVTIGSDAPWTVLNKATGATLMTGTSGGVTVTLESSTSKVNYRLQTACSGSATYRAEWLAKAKSLGYVTYTEEVPAANCTRLFIGEFAPPPANTFGARTTFRNKVMADKLAAIDSFWKVVTIAGVTEYKVTRGTDVVSSSNPVVLDAAGAIVQINGSRYRGLAEVLQNGSGTLAGVNDLPIEEYLYGVVPRELPPVPYGQPEAQKAQSVAARTYALSGLGKRASDGYDLLPTTTDQVYGGHAAEHAVSSAAVDATRGVVAVKVTNGVSKLISALYSSTTGGWTANNEEVYESAPVDYLRSVPDAQRGQAFEHVPTLEMFRNHANPRSLRAEHRGSAESDWSKYHRWTFEWDAKEISEVLSASYGVAVGTVKAINVLERGPSGRVMLIEFVTEGGTFMQTKDKIRATLKYITPSGGHASLLSTLFFIEPVVDKNTGAIGFRAFGGGWGHGVGMGQTGAAGMADKGATYDEILKHYYRGIDLETAY